MTIGKPGYEAVEEAQAKAGEADPKGIGPPPPVPPCAPERLEELGERIAELAAQISAATYELLVMLRDFDERGGWNSGFRSCAHWLGWRVGLDPG
ncbi:MAG TPA: hypothetical protein VHQ90_24115, partial [Thermoanaerobaculia bacterium]|nr:hypothetical protein [Thermoanaerobaculia bacterium]